METGGENGEEHKGVVNHTRHADRLTHFTRAAVNHTAANIDLPELHQVLGEADIFP